MSVDGSGNDPVAAPVGADELAGLFAGIDRPLAIAVSGGVDSMALMHLVAQWRKLGGGCGYPPPLVLTVDHGLRPESAEEADFVAGIAGSLGLLHETLVWRGDKPTSALQDRARAARYDLLLERLADDDHPRDLVLAHHLEDQAETLLMRLARGSGLDGLAAMRPVDGRVVPILAATVREVVIRLRRPLLDVAKARLVATMAARAASWRDDPSNRDVRFERVRLRRAQPELAALGLGAEALARSARRLRAEQGAAEARAGAIAARFLDIHDGAFGSLSLPRQLDWAPVDVVRLLGRLMSVYGGAAPAAQLSQIEMLAERVMKAGTHATGRTTLGGCIVAITDDGDGARTVAVLREAGRQPLPTVMLQPGTSLYWDRRFYVSLAATARQAVRVGPFGEESSEDLPAGLPRDIIAGLPALHGKDGRKLLWGRALPHVSCVFPGQHVAALRWRQDG